MTVDSGKIFCNSLLALFFLSAGLSGCTEEEADGAAKTEKKTQTSAKPPYREVGEASWYGPGFHGRETASGDIFDQGKMTAAHPTLPLGTEVEVFNLENKEKVDVKITDRGPYVKDRVIDLSREAAKQLDMKEKGTSKVRIEVTKPVKKKRSSGKTSSKTKKKPAGKTRAKSGKK